MLEAQVRKLHEVWQRVVKGVHSLHLSENTLLMVFSVAVGAAAALGTLVRSLQQEGWRVEDRGDEWFSVRLRQTQVGPSAGAAGAHQ